MGKFFQLHTIKDNRGSLTVIEKLIPFTIKRVYYIYDLNSSKRGFHKHKKTIQFAVCVKGSCNVVFAKNGIKTNHKLDKPSKGLLIEPDDYHWIENFSNDAILLVLASEYFDENDYIRKNED